MSRSPLPPPAAYQLAASRAAGLARNSGTRVRRSMAAAPARKPLRSASMRAAGSSPTAPVMLVRPPTQSGRSKRASQPSCWARWSRWLPAVVMATAWAAQLPPRASRRARACSMPMRGSGVPPDLLTTTTNVVLKRSPRDSRVVANPWGSTLSKRWKGSPLWGCCRARIINKGPRPEPPMPIQSTSLKGVPQGEEMDPERTWAAKPSS